MTNQPPLEIDASPRPYQVSVLIRQVLPPLVAFAVGRGWLANDSATLVAALAAIAVPILDGQRISLRRSRALIRLGAIVPDDVAVVR
ncbi:Pam3-gp28 family putative phage holin [Novosphingobium pokkalii]|uniref:Uncharacterized protein n=1 Tax=Novosphingobium pokkalii TaxID=1770194 RepID=A0ABV7V834_9SPHN|nr:hypothetical protein [Novosphingobium pokkalii]GHC97690.1 hypothetical protein GCM10019060_28710 [Novosphingobium pokkalii]